MKTVKYEIPRKWTRCGCVVARDRSLASSVTGDPCIVWDDEADAWRMALVNDPHGSWQAVCRTKEEIGPGRWELAGPISFTNPGDLLGGKAHKPFFLLEAHRPNVAARIEGQYRLLVVAVSGGRKFVQSARAERLAGPWTAEKAPLLSPGGKDAFDGKHTDAITGYYFPEREEILYFYMGYPMAAQDRPLSPLGSAQAVAVQGVREAAARKLGVILPPRPQKGHWAGGWVGGLQLLPGKRHRWIAVINASPTAPQAADTSISREEPPPSLGGFAWCDESWPVAGWELSPEPMERIEDIPAEAVKDGEGANLWRHYILCLPGGRMGLFYNSGPYGTEQIYLKTSD